MMSTRAASIALLATGVAAGKGRNSAKVNPLGQVLSLMEGLTAKIQAEGEAEAKAYKEYVEWCDDVSTNGAFTIKTAESDKEKLEARIKEEAATITAAETEIEQLASDLSTADADLKAATGIRDKESAEYMASEKELLEAIDALGRAITILERKMKQNPAALAQVKAEGLQGVVQSLSTIVDAASFTVGDKNRLMALVQAQQGGGDDDSDLGAPAAAVYQSHSGSIFDVLEDLKEKAESQLSDLRKAEVNAKHNYQMLKQSLDDQMSADNKDLSNEKSGKASAEESKAIAEGELAVTVEDLKTSKEAMANAQSNCMTVAADHQATIAAREAELKVIDQAQKILQETSGGAVEQTYSLLQTDTVTGTKIHSGEDLARSEVVALLKKLAKEHHSAALAQLASRVSAVVRYGTGGSDDPFVKVKQMIQDMITKLQAEASSETNEKAYCDGEMAKTEEKKAELNHEAEKLTSKIDQASSRSASLKADVKELQAELATLAKEYSENEAWRQEAHADYVTAKSDLEQGLSGVRKALVVLRDYYAQEDGVSLIQQPEMPEHNKASGSGNSIIGILETVESDFAENLAKEETEEATAAESHEKWVMEYKLNKAKMEQDVKYKGQESTSLDKSISELNSDLQTADSELSAVMEYYGSLKERCIAKPETYEERKARREAEVEGLKEALNILEGEAIFTQRPGAGRRHLRGTDSALAPEH
eukprot:TRINITY_DN932_c0_g3_i1.p1 TRINITY_DN932_c0_g3~~TRINITY_DN932_c0_g3_i1.p1  ORF type:complete len:709 (+),score=307.22 TRINITY_DN932_c0_g3_i1:70-2196(+)